MARTPKMAHIKAQMAERERQEGKVASARNRSQRSQALQDARGSRVTPFGPHAEKKEFCSGPSVLVPQFWPLSFGSSVLVSPSGSSVLVPSLRKMAIVNPKFSKPKRSSNRSNNIDSMTRNPSLQPPQGQQRGERQRRPDYLQESMEATRQKFVIAEVINVARCNADLNKQVRFQGLPDSEIPLVPDRWEPYQRKYICTHGWKERKRSTGKRTSHKLRRTDCPFQMLAQVVMRRDGTWASS
ncbi:hypothetical protein PHYSODRAFT_333409 [Phytophthora sojae]|uniref:Uncharacterized protein n=1 Tax=Phytophthora sojae (strain P6497) TaxID=1094619 RepID=G4ZP99_PHYSP|nr:hypothetical protein PHYSODRAFT_333409 [Phytophthora sojae]EGZ15139.1 hypothetical protein PHYSODRAFT_333409 [Phytophthora sojae]|eukprot:XP_009528888.1 hypothetical protein PHYSODRAFT_333409 [Phytophthora sojae]